jgi:hypothetical protein
MRHCFVDECYWVHDDVTLVFAPVIFVLKILRTLNTRLKCWKQCFVSCPMFYLNPYTIFGVTLSMVRRQTHNSMIKALDVTLNQCNRQSHRVQEFRLSAVWVIRNVLSRQLRHYIDFLDIRSKSLFTGMVTRDIHLDQICLNIYKFSLLKNWRNKFLKRLTFISLR